MKLGNVSFDTIEYASRANAVIGIRDSGKSYTATLLGEQLLDSDVIKSGIPFIAFDPAGIWRFLRVPGKGKGYPVVVVGQAGADLPLKAQTIGKIVEAALRGRVSLVVDLSGDISKGDMRRIVTDCVKVLMAKNKQYGLRHVYIEEAAEFVPQRVNDGIVYAAVEKLVRVGGNMGLGVTLINPRTENLNKEVLELCDNIFLHRQKGKNSLKNLAGWFEATGNDASKELATSVSGLGTGECYVWLRDMEVPNLVKVQAKNSHHPNRRELGAPVVGATAAVDAASFVQALKDALPAVEKEIEENDPAILKRKLAEMEKRLRGVVDRTVSPPKYTGPSDDDKTRLRSEGYNAGWVAAMKENAKHRASINKAIAAASGYLERAMGAMPPIMIETQKPGIPVAMTTSPPMSTMPPNTQRALTAAAEAAVRQMRTTAPAEGVTKPQQKVLDALAWWAAAGHDQPSREQVAGVAGYSPTSGGFNNLLGQLNTAGWTVIPKSGLLQLTSAGSQIGQCDASPSTADLHARVRSICSDPQWKLLAAAIETYPEPITRDDLAKATEYSATSGGFNNLIGSLSTLRMFTKPVPGSVRAADWLFLGN